MNFIFIVQLIFLQLTLAINSRWDMRVSVSTIYGSNRARV